MLKAAGICVLALGLAGAAPSPPAAPARLAGCPETRGELRDLADSLKVVARGSTSMGEAELGYDVSGMKMFGAVVPQFMTVGTLNGMNVAHFRLPGELQRYNKPFLKFARKFGEASCRAGVFTCGMKAKRYGRGELSGAFLEHYPTGRGLLTAGTVLTCFYAR